MRPAKGTEMDQGGQKRINYFSKRSSGIEKDQVYFKVIKGGLKLIEGGLKGIKGHRKGSCVFGDQVLKKDRVYLKGIEWD